MLRVIFVDMNAYFASVEQQLNPCLRGKPVGVVALNVDSTCCIAASYEAKAWGVRTGTPVWEAKRICPGIHIVAARPEAYVETHHRIIAAVHSCIPVHAVESIDEMWCRLDPRQATPALALRLGRQIKEAIVECVGPFMKCSIGVAPNRLLAKIASDLQKPDGLSVLTPEMLPEVLDKLELRDLPGIARGMERRLLSQGVCTIRHLYCMTEAQMAKAWGGIVGRRWWHWLRGEEWPDTPTRRRTFGRSHVLPPAHRSEAGARAIIILLIHKVAERMRREKYSARWLDVYISYSRLEEGWRGSVAVGHARDTLTLIDAFNQLWRTKHVAGRPTHVAVTLHDLWCDGNDTLPLFQQERDRLSLANAMDHVNRKYGAGTLYWGAVHGLQEDAPTRISFNRIPKSEEFANHKKAGTR